MWYIRFLARTKLGLINVIRVKEKRRACVEEIKTLKNEKCSRALSARLKVRRAIVSKLMVKYALDRTLSEIR